MPFAKTGVRVGFEEGRRGFHSRSVEFKVLLIKRDANQTSGCSKLEMEFGIHQGVDGRKP